MRLSLSLLAKKKMPPFPRLTSSLRQFQSFQLNTRKDQLVVYDPKFYLLSEEKQKRLVLEKLPSDLRGSYEIETKAVDFVEDHSVRKLELKKDLTPGFKEPSTPQGLLDDAVNNLNSNKGVAAADLAWLSASTQLRWFLETHGIEADSHSLKSMTVQFLKTLSPQLGTYWLSVEFGHIDSYTDERSMGEIENFLTASESFSNCIYDIHQQKLFKKENFIEWILESNTKFRNMGKLKILVGKNWMMLKEIYSPDLVVIGSGLDIYLAAIKAAQLGMKAVCVEKNEILENTCSNDGFIPSKILLNNPRLYYLAKHGKTNAKGDETKSLYKMMKVKHAHEETLTNDIASFLKTNNVNHIKGVGTITGPNQVTVKKEDGTTEVVNTRRILISSCSEVMPFPGVDIDEQQVMHLVLFNIVSTVGALSLKKVPERVVVIGAGTIGLEWCYFINNFCGNVWQKQGANVISATKDEHGKVKVNIQGEHDGKDQQLECDVLLVSKSKRPSATLGLENVKLNLDEKGRIKINDKFQTNVPSIYAIGDIIKSPLLTDKYEDEGILAVKAMSGLPVHNDYDIFPSIIYTHPEVAWVGKSEEELKKEGISYKIGKFPFSGISRARAVDIGFVKVLGEKEFGRLLGVHIIGQNASVMIDEATYALKNELYFEDICIPKFSRAFRKANCAAHFDNHINN
ncbi:Dihydrolipoyl dehydrogenase [Meloidogyne graminicola]|uniref:dihydrolipoyl dehydrogenase n=1 Tax=Meloidogyne graminicola TaxID=189291 RepID=A0A8S9ZAG6_9BILA|nr:Dihydrolipoyl dehydrogenase [Meloidogyne graminicola]